MLYKKRKSLKIKKCLQIPLVQIPFQSQPSLFKLPDLFDNELYELGENVCKKKRVPQIRNKCTQTDFRDSETQTVPWEPSYIIRSDWDENCSVLQLSHLTWGHGLPAGSHEVEMINTMKKKKEWMEKVPPFDSKKNLRLATKILATVEAIEWNYREKEIQCVLDIRMELFNKLMRTRNKNFENKIGHRLNVFNESLNCRRNKTISKIRQRFSRDLRKLGGKYQSRLIFNKSFAEAPHPGSNLPRDFLKLDAKLINENIFDEPSSLPTIEELKAIQPKQKPGNLCVKYTKWNQEKLKTLYEELKSIRLTEIKTNKLSSRKLCESKVPSCLMQSDWRLEIDVNDSNKAALSVHEMMKQREREKFKDVIENLKSTHGLFICNTMSEEEKEKARMLKLQMEKQREIEKTERVNEIFDSLEGATLSGLLDFLSKELIRLEDEQRTHSYILLASKVRKMKEAAEFDDQETHIEHQAELEKVFREIIQVDRESADAYLEKLIDQDVDPATRDKVKNYILDMCDKINTVNSYLEKENLEGIDESIIANILNSCLEMQEEEQPPEIIFDVFDLLTKQKCAEIECSFTDYSESTSRSYTMDDSTQTWLTFEEDEVNEIDEIIHGLINDIVASFEEDDEEYSMLDYEIFIYYYERLSIPDESGLVSEL